MSQKSSLPMPKRAPLDESAKPRRADGERRRRALIRQPRARRGALSAWFALLLAVGCSGNSTVYEIITVNGGAPAVSAGAGAPSANGGVSAMGGSASSGGANFGGASSGGNAGGSARAGANASGADGDAGGMNSGGGGASAGAAATGSESAGDAGASGVACGTLLPDEPPDCHASIACSDSRVVDQNDVPRPTNACIVGTCNSTGVPGTAPALAGTACSAAGGGRWCDGVGKCVSCLQMSDCKVGQICSASRQCVSGSCTDLDCGGACPPCANGKKCLADGDCASFACDAASLTCITPQCQDHRQDGVETDADCGGGFCTACVLGKGCLVDPDCLSLACDALTLTCINNSCADHRTDGDETDVDCGGSCQPCSSGSGCHTSFDCYAGHFCNSKHVCQ